jgi:hypothetical protein
MLGFKQLRDFETYRIIFRMCVITVVIVMPMRNFGPYGITCKTMYLLL